MRINTKLIVLITVFIVFPMGLIGVISVYSSKDNLEQARFAQLEAITDLKKRQITSFFNALKADLQIAQDYYNIKTNLPIISNLLSNRSSPSYTKARNMLNGQLKAWFITRSDIADLMLVNLEGKVVYSANPKHEAMDLGNPLPDPGNQAFQQGVNEIYITGIFKNRVENNRFTIIAAAPAYDFNKQLIGVIAIEVHMKEIFKLLQDTTGLGITGETLIGKKLEEKALFLSPLRHDKEAALTRTVPFGEQVASPIQEAVNGREGSGIAIDYQGKEVIAVWRYIPALNWGFVAKIDASEAFAPIDRLRDQTIQFGVLVVLLGILITLAISRSISRPIRHLKRSVDKIGTGDLAVRSDVKSRDEIGSLARGINSMAESLETREASLRKLSLAMEQSPASIIITDLQGHIEYVNPKFTEITGYEPDEVIGKNPSILQSGETPPEKYKDLWQTISSGEEWRGEILNAKKEGGLYWVSTSISPVTDNQGMITHYLAVDEDITDRKTTEEQLRRYRDELEELVEERTATLQKEIEDRKTTEKILAQSEARFRELAETVNETFWITTADGHEMIYASPAYETIWGRSVEDLYEDPNQWLNCIHPEDRNDVEAAFYNLDPKEKLDVEYRIRRPDGEERWIHNQGFPVLSEDGKIIRILGLAADITEQRLAEQALREAKDAADAANLAKSEFLANMSHEIRTPMNAIIGLSQLALRGDLPPQLHDYLGKIYKSSQSLQRLLNNILDYSKIEARRLDIEHTVFLLDDVLGHVSNLFGGQADEKGIELLFRIAPGVPQRLMGDSLRLGQILNNLVGNAIKFTEEGEIEVSIQQLEEDEDRVRLCFTVRDTGMGMDQQQADHLFEPFTQADGTITRRFGGTGLGLAITRQLVELMGGEISVESRVGEGCLFYFTANFMQPEEPLLVDNKVLSGIWGKRILVAENQATVREVLSDFLSSWSLEVDTATSGEEALAILVKEDQQPYEILLLDWRMPDMSGSELAQQIHKLVDDGRLKQIAIMLMVPPSSREAVMRKAPPGIFDFYLNKPVTPSTLLNGVIEVASCDRPALMNITASLFEKAADIHGARILLAEDDAINRQVARELLKQAGLSVDMAVNGQEAVDAVGKEKYDAVIMDLQMPELDGISATRVIREQDPDLPIIAMTAAAMADDRAKCIAAGMNDYVTKPVDQEILIDILLHWIKPVQEGAGKSGLKQSTANLEQIEQLIREIHAVLKKSELVSPAKLDELYDSLSGVIARNKIEQLKQTIDNFDYEAALNALASVAIELSLEENDILT